MIRLDLTIPQADWLHQFLLDQAPDGHSLATSLLTQLDQAYDQATTTQTCPVCHATFTQLQRGRSGLYCSPACKQKAYRQRRNAWRRYTPTRPLPD